MSSEPDSVARSRQYHTEDQQSCVEWFSDCCCDGALEDVLDDSTQLTLWKRAFIELVIMVVLSILLVTQMWMLGNRLDHLDDYTVRNVSWYTTLTPYFMLVAFKTFFFFVWFAAISRMKSAHRRQFQTILAGSSVIASICILLCVFFVVENLEVIRINRSSVLDFLSAHSSSNQHGNNAPLNAWPDDEDRDTDYQRPDITVGDLEMVPLPHTWFGAFLPLTILAGLIGMWGIVSILSGRSLTYNFISMCFLDGQLADASDIDFNSLN